MFTPILLLSVWAKERAYFEISQPEDGVATSRTSCSNWTNFRDLSVTWKRSAQNTWAMGTQVLFFYYDISLLKNNFLASFVPVREHIKRFSTPLFIEGTHCTVSASISLLQNITSSQTG